jgi:hypothetical protein
VPSELFTVERFVERLPAFHHQFGRGLEAGPLGQQFVKLADFPERRMARGTYAHMRLTSLPPFRGELVVNKERQELLEFAAVHGCLSHIVLLDKVA